MQAIPESRDVLTEQLRLVYEVAAGTPAEPLQRAVAEACRRHRAQPRDITVAVMPAGERSAPARLTITTPVPVSHDGRGREALLRDIETVLTDTAPRSWRRLTYDAGAVDSA
jgi:hypothetical protein